VRVVIDTNRLQSQELWGFLAMAPGNVAVLPDYVLMEAFKPGRLDGLQAAVSILRRFPCQVLALHGTGTVCRLDPDAVAMTAAMISQDETNAFPSFCEYVLSAGGGGEIDDKLAERTQWAREQMAVIDREFSNMAAALREFATPFTADELRRIRRAQPVTPPIVEKFFGLGASMANRIFELRGDITVPRPDRRADHFVVRTCIAYAVCMITSVRTGGRTRKAELARNDSIDVLLATYGTYFDGVMSEDALTNEVFMATRLLLESTRARMGGDYLAHGAAAVAQFLKDRITRA
jgi:hypothetical protein